MKPAITATTAYFLILFALGFVLGTFRVTLIAPRFGAFAATLAEVPIMLIAAYFACRWVVRRWHVPRATLIRTTMVFWFLVLLFLFETLFGALLFERTFADQWATFMTAAGLLGLSAQIIAALLPLVVGRRIS
jgi:hypothetical protein